MHFNIRNFPPIPNHHIGYNDGLNFGRYDAHFQKDFIDFELALTKSEFQTWMEQEYKAIRDEIKKDDETYADDSAFKHAGYPDLKELLYPDSGLEAIFCDYLDRSLYQRITHSHHSPRYIIQGTSGLLIKDDLILISGKCFVRASH